MNIIHRFLCILSLLAPLASFAQVKPATRMILFGGREMPAEATKLAAKWGARVNPETGKREKGKLLIIGFPSTIPQDYFHSIGNEFQKHAAYSHQDILTIESIQTPEARTHFLDLLSQAEIVYVTGGSQSAFMETLQTWGLTETFRTAVKSKVYLGKSAGTASTARVAITGNTTPPMEGLGLLDAIVDTHFLKRDREVRLKNLMRETHMRYGIGVDEDGALAFEGTHARVIGGKDMMFYEWSPLTGEIKSHQIRPDHQFNLSRWSPAPLLTSGCGKIFNQ